MTTPSWKCLDLQMAITSGYATPLQLIKLQTECSTVPPASKPVNVTQTTRVFTAPAGAPPPGSSTGMLPFTGAGLGFVLVVAVVLVAAGIWLRWSGRQPRA